MSQSFDRINAEIARGTGTVGPAGRPKPLRAEDVDLVPDKGNLGGPGNYTANGGRTEER